MGSTFKVLCYDKTKIKFFTKTLIILSVSCVVCSHKDKVTI